MRCLLLISTGFGIDPKLPLESTCRMRGETMKDKSKKSTYSTTFGVDPNFCRKRRFLRINYSSKNQRACIWAQKKWS